MVNYEIHVQEELNSKLKKASEVCDVTIEDLIDEFAKNRLSSYIAEFVLEKYKEGNIKAREAWKASGLNYQEFQNRIHQ